MATPDDEIPATTKRLLEIARRDGWQLDDPEQREAFMREVHAHVAREAASRAETTARLGGAESWQMAELWERFAGPLLERLSSQLPSPPDFALLLVLGGSEQPSWRYETDERIAVRVTFADGPPSEGGLAPIARLGGAALEMPARIEPLVPWDAFFLWVFSGARYSQELFAWDLRPFLARASDSACAKLLKSLTRTRVSGARQRRTAQLAALQPDDRLTLLREAIGMHIAEPGVRRIPLHGLVQAGHPVCHIDGAEGGVQPFRFMDIVDRLLRELALVPRRQGRTVPSDESEEQFRELKNPLQYTERVEELATIHKLMGFLSEQERTAVLLVLEAEHEGRTTREHCEATGHSYDAVKRAHSRAIARLRKLTTPSGG